MRIFSSLIASLNLEKIGMRGDALKAVRKSMTKSKGIILTAGPTGAGKTTTLYSILKQINTPDIKIITIEDPIEYHMDGVMQTQVDVDKEYTFSSALKSFMRQNPNVIMIGEVRDKETAETAIEASVTGHLVMSTIHSNNASAAILRLINLGVDRTLLGSSLELSIGQRLARRICPHCRVEDKISDEALEDVKDILAEIPKSADVEIPKKLKFYKGKGCKKCGNIGYTGRLGIFEVIQMSPEIKKVIQSTNITDKDIEKIVVKQGQMLMIHDGILKALEGETTVDEIFRVAR